MLDQPVLFPAVEPYDHGYLPLVDGHRVYYEQCGHPAGVPVVFLHGGPGSGCGPQHRRVFNPSQVRAILFDQRGCGRSQAVDPLHANTTAHLLVDIERLREQLGIERWWVVGGSWGGGLGVAYASQHPERCLGAVLRSVFLSRPQDIDWFFDGARRYLPDAWDALSPHWRDANGLRDIASLMQSDDLAWPLTQAWHAWEQALTQRHWSAQTVVALLPEEAAKAMAKYRLQSHYLSHQCFFPQAGLLSHVSAIAHLPVILVHGRLDWVCLPEAAWALHEQLPGSQMQWVENAGHSPFEPAMISTWIQAIHQGIEGHLS